MQLTTKTEYAIRAMIELSIEYGNKPLAIREICERQNLPAKYIEQIFRKLRKSNLIKSVKGSLGGYMLSSEPTNISLKEIMIAVEDNFVSENCSGKEGSREFCVGAPCNFYKAWERITSDLDSYFSRIRLSSFLTYKSGKTYHFSEPKLEADIDNIARSN